MLPMAVARSSSGGVAICYVFPVLWMTSYLHILPICRGAGVTLEQPASRYDGAARAVTEAASHKPVTL